MLKNLIQTIIRDLAKRILAKYKPDVIGITGSVGKTSSKEAIAYVLESKFAVRRTLKNYNNEIGLPLTIIGVEKTPGKSILGWLGVIWKAKNIRVNRSSFFTIFQFFIRLNSLINFS